MQAVTQLLDTFNLRSKDTEVTAAPASTAKGKVKDQGQAEEERLLEPWLKREPVKFGHEARKLFMFDEGFRNLNHGSFGTYPTPLLPILHHYQHLAESRPDAFIRYAYPILLARSRAAIAPILHAPVETITFVQNATTGINTVLRNLVFEKGDVIVYFSTIYGACEKSVEYVAETTPVVGRRVQLRYPEEDEDVVGRFREAIREEKSKGNRVRLGVFDTVCSLPGVRMPFERLTEVCREEGVMSCVDGAHGIGHVELNLGELDCDFFVSNVHKWFFTPRGCAVFYVPVRNQHLLRSTLPTSHGFIPKPNPSTPSKINNPLPPTSTSPYITNFSFIGTKDDTPYLLVPAAILLRSTLFRGESSILSYTHSLARRAGLLVSRALGTEVMENSTSTLGNCCFVNVRLPLDVEYLTQVAMHDEEPAGVGRVGEWVAKVLVEEYETFVAVILYEGAWWVRLSAQVYLEEGDWVWCGEVLGEVCERVRRGEWRRVYQKGKEGTGEGDGVEVKAVNVEE